MKKSLLFISIFLLVACSQTSKKMTVSGTIKGQKKEPFIFNM